MSAEAGDDEALRREGDRIAQLIDDLGALGGAPVRQRAEELVQRLVHLYGVGLARLMQLLGGDRLDEAAEVRLRGDALVSSLLVLHGLHPDPSAADDFADPEPTGSPSSGGLVQIDVGRGRSAKAAGTP